MSSDQAKIKNTVIERGVRIKNGNDDTPYDKAQAVAAVKQKRDNERLALHQLNDRFAKYIERVKFLENQNKKLLAELDELRQRWGEETRLIRERYEPELLQVRAAIDDATQQKSLAEIKAKRREYDAANFKRQYDDEVNLVHFDKNKMTNLEYLYAENQTELNMLRRQISDAESDIEKYKRELQRLNDELARLLAELDEQTLRRVRLENEKQTLEEQIPFLNAIHEQEMAELRSLQACLSLDPAQFYRHELVRAIRDIRSDFDELNDAHKHEIEEWYRIKTEELAQEADKRDALDVMLHTNVESSSGLRSLLQEGQQELNHLKQANAELVMRLGKIEEELDSLRRNNSFTLDQRDREIAEMRARLQDMMSDYEELMNSKTSLEFEIKTYRRLLDCEDLRTSRFDAITGDRGSQRISTTSTHIASIGLPKEQAVEVSSPKVANNDLSLTTSEMSSKTTFQRSAKGPVSISECSPDGKMIKLENTSRNKDVTLTNWTIKRVVDSKDEIAFKLPENFVLKAGKTVQIWARNQGKENLPSDLVNQELDNWGLGLNILTRLFNEADEEKATHVQKTVYVS